MLSEIISNIFFSSILWENSPSNRTFELMADFPLLNNDVREKKTSSIRIIAMSNLSHLIFVGFYACTLTNHLKFQYKKSKMFACVVGSPDSYNGIFLVEIFL